MKLLVIDGNSIVNRAFFGMHPLNNREGFPTHAIFGFLNILRRMEEEVDPDGMCVTFDRKEPTFRHLAYAEESAARINNRVLGNLLGLLMTALLLSLFHSLPA